MPRIIGVTKARHNFTKLVGEADQHGDPIYVTHFNEPRVVLISYRVFEDLLQRMEDLEDMISIYRGRGEPTRPFEEFWTEIEQEAGGLEQIPASSGTVG